MTASSVEPKRFSAITSTSSNVAKAGHSPLTFSQLDKLTSSIVNITSSSSLLPPSSSQHTGLRLLQELFELSVPIHTNAQHDHINTFNNYEELLTREKERNESYETVQTKESTSRLLSLFSEVMLRKHGFPTRDRLATSFAAAQKHSAEGALLQLFAEGIARLFSGETCELQNLKPNTPTELKYKQNLGDIIVEKNENKNIPTDIHQVKEHVCKNLKEENNEFRYEKHEEHQNSRDYENNYITRMFDNLQSTAGFASEWEQTLKECVRANSSLQAHLYELQGFGVLYSYIWSQTAMLVALMHKMKDSDDITLAKQLQERESVANKYTQESSLYKNQLDCIDVDKCNTYSDFAIKSNSKGNNMIITTATTSSTKSNSHDINSTSDKMQLESKNESYHTNEVTRDNNNNIINSSKEVQHRLPLKLKFATLPATTTVHVQSVASPDLPVSLHENNRTNYNKHIHSNNKNDDMNGNKKQTHTSYVLQNHSSSEKKEEGKVYTPRLAVHSHALGELTKTKRKYAQLSNSYSYSSSFSLPLTLPIHGLQPNINNCVIGDEQVKVNSTPNIHINNDINNNKQENAKGLPAMTQPTLKNRWVSTLPFVRDTKRDSNINNNNNNDNNEHCLHNREQVHDMRSGNSSQAQEIKTYMSQLRAMMDEELTENRED